MGKKVLIVSPIAPQTGLFGGACRQPSVGTLTLGATLKNAGHDVTVLDECVMSRPVAEGDLDADWLCLSLISSSAARGYQIAQLFRKRSPKGRIAAGGVHPTFMPDEALQYADVVCRGEADTMIAELLGSGASGIVEGTPLADMDSLPLADYSLLAHADCIPFAGIVS
ncbi:MAG TPA: cobalamin-dependent protein [Candidatus Brocadiia bacterium]|nr:cobalamin-dependent protein [Candidatus Brocadiia bacterium]